MTNWVKTPSGDLVTSEMLLPDEFLCECLYHPPSHPGSSVTLNHPAEHECPPATNRWWRNPNHAWVCFTGAIFRQSGYVYRVGDYHAETNCWPAWWPD